jgi:branched-chain amino acid transport system substrate-binding protein
MKLAAHQINSHGGIKALGGAKIKIVTADTSSDNPAQAKSVTSRMLGGNNISALVGSYLSSMTLTSVVAAETGKVPMITQSYVNKLTESGYKYLFQIAPRASQFGKATVEDVIGAAKASGHPIKSVAIVDGNDASAKAQSAAVANEAKKRGLKVVANITYPDGLSSASSIVRKVSASNADVVIAGGALPDITLIIRGLRTHGVTTPVVNPGGGGTLTPKFASTLGKYANGVLSTSAWNSDLNLPGVKQTAKAYKNKYGVFMPQEAGESWAAVYDIKKAIKMAHSQKPQKIRNALAALDAKSGSASAVPPGRVAFTSNGANKYIKPILVQWQNGKLRTVGPSKVATTTVLKSTFK